MKSVLLLALVASLIVGCNCDKADDVDKFVRICRAESEAREAFDDYLGNEEEKDALFWVFLKARGERVALSKILGDVRCANEEVVDDEQVFHHLCSDHMAIKLAYASNQEQILSSRIDKMLRGADWRRRKFDALLWFETGKTLICPVSSSDTKLTDLNARLKEKLREFCKEEAFYDHVKRRITNASKEIKLELTQIPPKEAGYQYDEAREAREQFCEGPIETCCDERLVEQGRAEASLRAAEILLEMVEGSVGLVRSMYEQEKRDNQWEAKFKRACVIEQQTASGSLPVRSNILADLYQQAVDVRTIMGEGLGDKSCPVENYPQSASKPIQQDNKPDAACDLIKARVMCRAMNNANEFELFKYNEPAFQQRRTSWCAKAKMDAGPRGSRCSNQMSAMLTNEALAEAQVSLELLKLDDGSWRLSSLRAKMLNAAREEFAALKWVEQFNKEELNEQTSEIRKEKSRQAAELISDKLAQLRDETVY